MPPLRSRLRAVAGLEMAEIARSRWLPFCFGAYALLAGVFVLVGLRESSVMGFTGMGRVLFSFCHALVLFLPLLALTATAPVLPQARASGALELLLTQPLSRRFYFGAVAGVRMAVLAAPLALLLGALAAWGKIGFGEPVPWSFLAKSLGVAVSLLWSFVGIGMLISSFAPNAARATMWILLVWIAAAALMDFALVGLMLQWRLQPQAVFALAALNPVEAARLALLSAAEPELSVLGPVGFFLANRVGAAGLLLLGLLWPALLGTLCFLAGAARFRRRDLV